MITTVIVANAAEAFEQLLEKVSKTDEGARRIRHEMTLSQRAFFYGGDNKVIITPQPIPEELIRRNAALCGFSNVLNICPEKLTVALSRSASRNTALIELLTKILPKDNSVEFLPYAAVPAFRIFVREVRKTGIQATTEEDSDAFPQWVSEYLDSKVGFRAEMQRLAGANRRIQIPEGFVGRNAKEAISMAEWFYARGHSAVIKTNFGESGWGLWALKAEAVLNATAARKAFRLLISSDPIWRNTLFVVEEFIEADESVAGGSPSVELFIGNDSPRATYCCGQLLDSGKFFGIEMGKGILPRRIKDALVQIALAVGDRYHELGYRGFCDIDFVVARNGDLYAVETNPRRTGGTHVYDLAKRLFGNSWESERYFLSHDSFQYGAHVLSAGDLLEITQPLLFPIRGKQRGVVITSVNPTDPVIGYVIIETDKKSGARTQPHLHSLFGTVR
ncbi:MAG: hypothetical protein A2941_00160 [Candidatus Yanofskybacteria bacterium RIFCSPLOWO2_01_FULL_49_17]|uniref:ATP-grasp domain-containing protein n=1 Tax=Candidatus Yanofskybacteria bacterium RIFCSPLOWO2_01_FULL_49_17 TaxID=1802700 RepID=A0A1F8GRM6_9BACT|nr:MAG: hypothetical protein A2941_00160 [Candidatus Yanofskybacteria bacterium RIFCSPLOWO2_01_FULL_49_17]